MSGPTERGASLSGKRVLITGARGFLGGHLRDALQASNCELHGLVRALPADIRGTAGIRLWKADAADATGVERVVGTVKPDVIFHMTSHAWGAPDLDKVLPTLQDDLVATVNVLTSAARAGIERIVTTGSMQEPRLVGDRSTPCSPYAAAKAAGGMYARMFHELFALPVVVVRPFMVYGPGQAPSKVIPYIIRSFMDDESPKIAEKSQLVDWIYVDDVIDGLIKAATAPGIEGRTLELGSGHAVPLATVVSEIAALVSTTREPEFGAYSRPLERLQVADAEATWQALGWRAEVSLSEGLRRTVDHLRAQRSPGALTSRVALWGGISANLATLGVLARNASHSFNLS